VTLKSTYNQADFVTAAQFQDSIEDMNEKLKKIEQQDKYAIFETNQLDPLNS